MNQSLLAYARRLFFDFYQTFTRSTCVLSGLAKLFLNIYFFFIASHRAYASHHRRGDSAESFYLSVTKFVRYLVLRLTKKLLANSWSDNKNVTFQNFLNQNFFVNFQRKKIILKTFQSYISITLKMQQPFNITFNTINRSPNLSYLQLASRNSRHLLQIRWILPHNLSISCVTKLGTYLFPCLIKTSKGNQ